MKRSLQALIFSSGVALQSIPERLGSFEVPSQIDGVSYAVSQTLSPSLDDQALGRLLGEKLDQIEGIDPKHKELILQIFQDKTTQKQIQHILKTPSPQSQNLLGSLLLGFLFALGYFSAMKKINKGPLPITQQNLTVFSFSSFGVLSLGEFLPGSWIHRQIFLFACYTLYLHIQSNKYSPLGTKEHIEEYMRDNPLPVVVYDADHCPSLWNKQMEEATGYTYDEVLNYFTMHKEVYSLLYKGAHYAKVVEITHQLNESKNPIRDTPLTMTAKSGEEKTFLWTMYPCDTGGSIRTAVSINKILDIQKELDTTKALLSKDPLTQAYSRTELEKDLLELFDHHERFQDPKEVVLALIDIDYFKFINDLYGHALGDVVLKELTRYIQTHLRHEDRLYRIGGDEFMILFTSGDLESIQKKIHTLREGFYELVFPHDTQVTHIGTSWGISKLSTKINLNQAQRQKIIETVKHQVDYYMYSVKYFSLIHDELLARGIDEKFLSEKNALAIPHFDENNVLAGVCIHSSAGEIFITQAELDLIVERKKEKVSDQKSNSNRGFMTETETT